jgi:hypothetical protein
MVTCYHRGLPIGPARCGIECAVLLVGWLLGGPLGLGAVLPALGTGPAVQLAFRRSGSGRPRWPAGRPRPPKGADQVRRWWAVSSGRRIAGPG